MRLNPEESLEWLEGYEFPAPWVADVYAWIKREEAISRKVQADLMAWAKERGLLDHPALAGSRPLVIPVKTGRSRP